MPCQARTSPIKQPSVFVVVGFVRLFKIRILASGLLRKLRAHLVHSVPILSTVKETDENAGVWQVTRAYSDPPVDRRAHTGTDVTSAIVTQYSTVVGTSQNPWQSYYHAVVLQGRANYHPTTIINILVCSRMGYYYYTKTVIWTHQHNWVIIIIERCGRCHAYRINIAFWSPHTQRKRIVASGHAATVVPHALLAQFPGTVPLPYLPSRRSPSPVAR